MNAAVQAVPALGPVAACEALGVSRASLHRLRNPPPALAEPRCRPSPPRALTVEERAIVLGHLHAERFQDRSPAEVYGTLLDEGVYCCSIRTLYRLLAAEGESRERRDQLIHPPYQKPQLLATAPNQLWSWDITKLLGPAKWTYFYLYVILDVFSRYVVGWMVAHREGKELARQFIAETCAKHQIVPGQLTLHADRGSPMTSKPVAFLLADLGVTKDPQPPARLRRQSLLGEPFQDLEVSTGVSRPLRLPTACPELLPGVLLLVQHRASSFRSRTADPRGGSQPPGRTGPRPPSAHARHRLCRTPRTFRPEASAAARAADRRLDQPATQA